VQGFDELRFARAVLKVGPERWRGSLKVVQIGGGADIPPGIFKHVKFNKCAVFPHEVGGCAMRWEGESCPPGPLTLSTACKLS